MERKQVERLRMFLDKCERVGSLSWMRYNTLRVF